jgi:chemotaxis signal transduction protein
VSDRPSKPGKAGKRGGLLLRVDKALHFLPAGSAVRIAQTPELARVPGAPAELLGIAAHEGDIVPVVAIGDDRSNMVVCSYSGELLGIVGATVIGAGLFDVLDTDEVSFLGESAKTLDLASIYARLKGGAWAERWGG